MRARARSAAALGLAVAALAAAWLWRERPAPPPDPGAGSTPRAAAAPSTTAPVAARSGLPPLPPSLRGTSVDGALAQDAQGRFVPTPDALRLFDYFLSASGEEPLESIRARILAEIEARLPAAAAADAAQLLGRYLTYREALRALADARLAQSSDLERRLQWLRELRREHFGAATADALFGDEEQAQRLRIESIGVRQDPTLSAQERAARLAALQRELPESVQRAHAEAAAPLRALHEEQALRDSGASAAQVQAWRERTLGPEAAGRLATLDAERAVWERRLAAYRAERDALRAAGAAAPEAVEALRARHFEGPELTRVRALDSLEPRADTQP